MKFRFKDAKEVDKLELVPEPFRFMYKQNGDKYELIQDYAAAADTFDGLNDSLDNSRDKEKKALEEAKKVDLSALSDFGADPKEIKETVDAKIKEAMEAGKGDASKLVEKTRNELASQYEKEKEKLTADNQSMQGKLYELLVTNAAREAITSERGSVRLLEPIIKNQVKVTAKDGDYHVCVVDKDGDPRHNIAGQPMGIQELVKEIKSQEDFAPAFASDAPSGGGSGKNPVPPKPTGNQPENPTSKISAGLQSGRGRYGAGEPAA